MITETTKLVTTFLNSEKNPHKWTYNDVDTSLSPQEIKDACQLLTSLELFEKDGVKLFDSVVSAKFVTRRETLIFDVSLDQELSTEGADAIRFPLVDYVDTVDNTTVSKTEPCLSTNTHTGNAKSSAKALAVNADALPAFTISAAQLPVAPVSLPQTSNVVTRPEKEQDSTSHQAKHPIQETNYLKRLFTRICGKQAKEDSS